MKFIFEKNKTQKNDKDETTKMIKNKTLQPKRVKRLLTISGKK